jgi:hypothetical protein
MSVSPDYERKFDLPSCELDLRENEGWGVNQPNKDSRLLFASEFFALNKILRARWCTLVSLYFINIAKMCEMWLSETFQ